MMKHNLAIGLSIIILAGSLTFFGYSQNSSSPAINDKHDHNSHVIDNEKDSNAHVCEDGCCNNNQSINPHEGHDHTESEVQDAHVTDDGHNHSAHSQDDGHGHSAHAGESSAVDIHVEDPHAGHAHNTQHDESTIQINADDLEKFGIKMGVANPGKLESKLHFPGEIKLNEDRIAHIVPRAEGIVREVTKSVGDTVKAGDVLAWIESAELSEAKVDYLAKQAELGCCLIDLTRAEQVHENTSAFLQYLETNPALEDLQEASTSVMGDNRSKLVSAYVEYVFAKTAYDREKSLYEKNINRHTDFLDAENAYKKAGGNYMAARDSIEFETRRELFEQKRERLVQEIELLGAERRLIVLGLSGEEIDALAQMVDNTDLEDEKQPHECSDPNCLNCKSEEQSQSLDLTDILVTKQVGDCSDPNCADCKDGHTLQSTLNSKLLTADDHKENLGWYPLRAPFDGTIIEKHISLGEKVDDEEEEESAFTIADLETVWIDLNIFQKDLLSVKEGMSVSIAVDKNHESAEGVIDFILPVVDRETRTALARVILPNPDAHWRPGLFVSATLLKDKENSLIVVPKTALQNLDGETVVFIEEDGGFEPVQVSVGGADDECVEIRSGLTKGQRYVIDGAFELKAQIVTSGLDAHAGHGH